MTDTITIEVVEQTTATVRAECETLRTTRDEEAAAFEARKAEIAAVATELGNENSIGSELDDLLEEFGLPRRPQRFYTQVSAMIYLPTSENRQDIVLHGDRNYRATRTTVSRGLWWTGALDSSPDESCSCGNAERALMDWVEESYGIEIARRSFIQIGGQRCEGVDCEQVGDLNTDPGVPFPGVPMVAWAPAPGATPPPPIEPSVGETWYMVGNDTYGTSSRDGDPVVIERVSGPRTFTVHPADRPDVTWTLRRVHIRATPEAVPPSFDDLL